jgi:hypothetical protein
VPTGIRYEIAVNRFVRGTLMQQAVNLRLVHPYHPVQTLQARWPRVFRDVGLLDFLGFARRPLAGVCYRSTS